MESSSCGPTAWAWTASSSASGRGSASFRAVKRLWPRSARPRAACCQVAEGARDRHVPSEGAEKGLLADRLGEEVDGAERQRKIPVTEHRTDDDRYLAGFRPHLQRLEELPAVAPRHHNIEGDGIGLLPLGDREGSICIGGVDQAVYRAAEVVVEELHDLGIIFDGQDNRRHAEGKIGFDGGRASREQLATAAECAEEALGDAQTARDHRSGRRW